MIVTRVDTTIFTSLFWRFSHARLNPTCSHIPRVRFTSITMLLRRQRSSGDLHSLERHDRLAISVTMSATDEELQKLGKPSIYSGKEEDVWNEWSVAMRSYVSLLSTRSGVAGQVQKNLRG